MFENEKKNLLSTSFFFSFLLLLFFSFPLLSTHNNNALSIAIAIETEWSEEGGKDKGDENLNGVCDFTDLSQE